MLPVERGQLDLDRDVNDYLREIKLAEAFDAPVTMRHLMTHTAGFEDTFAIFALADDDPRSRAQALADTQPARVFAPGARVSYSNWGSELAAQVVADVSGRTYAEFLQTEVLTPLRLESTTLAVPGEMAPGLAAGLARGHRLERGRLVEQEYTPTGPLRAAGAMFSSASDMARWMRFHLNEGELDGVRLLSAATHRTLFSQPWGPPGDLPGFAHGFVRRDIGGALQVGHGGAIGAFYSMMWLEPRRGIGVFAASNTAGARVGPRVADRLFEHLAGIPAQAQPSAPTQAVDLQPYVGDYLTNRRSFTRMVRAGERAVTARVRESGEVPARLQVTLRGEVELYAPVAGREHVFENARGERLRFLVEGAQAVAMVDAVGAHTHERLQGIDHPHLLNGIGAATVLLAVTTLLGLWRRWRLQPEATAAGRWAARAGVGSAVLVLTYATLLVLALASVARVPSHRFSDFPTPEVSALAMLGWALPVAALALLALLPSAWRAGGWHWARRLHYTMFAICLAACAALLWHWKFYGAAIL